MQFQSPTIICGIQRSGSALLAGTFNVCGAFGSPQQGTDKLYENIKIREQIIVPYLKSLEVDPNGQFPLPPTNKLPVPADLANNVFQLLKEDGYRGGPWVLKGSRILLTWPIWTYAFPNAKWIIVRRRTGDIIASCCKTNYMQAFKNPDNCKLVGANTEAEGWKWWVKQGTRRMVDLISSGVNCNVLWPERFVNGDFSQLFNVIPWAGLNWNPEALTYLDTRLIKSRKKENIFRSPLERS